MDANLLLYAYNEDTPRHEPAVMFLTELAAREDVEGLRLRTSLESAR